MLGANEPQRDLNAPQGRMSSAKQMAKGTQLGAKDA